MKVKVIESEAEHEAALKRIESLMNTDRNRKESEEFRLLLLVVSDYEERHFPIGPPAPLDAIEFHIDRLGMAPKEVANLFGSAQRAREIRSGKKPLTLALVRKLSTALDIPADILIQVPTSSAQRLGRANSRTKTAAA